MERIFPQAGSARAGRRRDVPVVPIQLPEIVEPGSAEPQPPVPAGDQPVGFQNPAMAPDQRFQAAVSYSLGSPPRIGRRRILLSTGAGTDDVGRGGRNRSARSGRAVL